MAKVTGFMEYERKEDRTEAPEKRIHHFQEFHIPMAEGERRNQAARCKDCGVPFCHIHVMIHGMASGCPLGNLIPEWNDFLYRGNDRQALSRLCKTNNFPEFTSRVCPALCEVACTGHQTANPRIFAAGDCRRGQSLVVWAIREGRDAASEVDEFLMGYRTLL